jgi:hypothetical protein
MIDYSYTSNKPEIYKVFLYYDLPKSSKLYYIPRIVSIKHNNLIYVGTLVGVNKYLAVLINDITYSEFVAGKISLKELFTSTSLTYYFTFDFNLTHDSSNIENIGTCITQESMNLDPKLLEKHGSDLDIFDIPDYICDYKVCNKIVSKSR